MYNLIQYRPLFTTRILHEYYLPRESTLYNELSIEQRNRIFARQHKYYNISNDFDIYPTKESAEVLNNYKLIFKQDNFGFFVACKVNKQDTDHYKPFIPFDEPFCLRFAICLKNKRLVNFSNLRQEKDGNRKDRFMYYFSNRANNSIVPDTLYLSNPVGGFDEGKDYEAGEIYLDNSDPVHPEMYEAIKDNGPAAIENSDWIRIFADREPLPSFVTNDDRIVMRPKIFNYDVASASLENLSIIINDYYGNQVKILSYETSHPGEFLTQCELVLTDLPSAYYSLEVRDGDALPVEGLKFTFYLDDTLYIKKPFALIECFHIPDGSLNNYKLVDETNDKRLLSPHFTIHWKNRSTYWRYYYNNAPEFSETPELEIYSTASGAEIDNILVTKNPLGLTQFNRRLSAQINATDTFLPNPGTASIFPEHERIYSEINMGGGLGPPPTN